MYVANKSRSFISHNATYSRRNQTSLLRVSVCTLENMRENHIQNLTENPSIYSCEQFALLKVKSVYLFDLFLMMLLVLFSL